MTLTYYVELVQTDPPGSPTPGLGHYCGEVAGFSTPEEAAEVGRSYLGKTLVESEYFHPCCDWQDPGTPVTGFVVYDEDEDGNRSEAVTYFSEAIE